MPYDIGPTVDAGNSLGGTHRRWLNLYLGGVAELSNRVGVGVPPANRGFLYAKAVGGNPHLFFKSSRN